MHEPPVEEIQSLADKMRIEVPDLHISLDSGEYEVVLDAIRNILLAPPYEPSVRSGTNENVDRTAKNSSKQDGIARGVAQESLSEEYHIVSITGSHSIGQGIGTEINFNVASKEQRYGLKAVVEEQLLMLAGQRAIHGESRVVRDVEYSFGQVTWSLLPLKDEMARNLKQDQVR